MKNTLHIIIVMMVFLFAGCEEYWAGHYAQTHVTVDQPVWDALKEDPGASVFVEMMEKFKLDTLFDYNNVFTLFVPDNEAFANYQAGNEVDTATLAYHILRYYIQPVNITGIRKIQTSRFKFAQFENRNGQYLYDDIPVTSVSPLYKDGRYFIIGQVSVPHPSLYEYITDNIPALKRFIDAQDSIALDKELSKPIGFDEDGNTVYDSVVSIINKFEQEYFEVSKEFRVKTATLVFPKNDLYNGGLERMARKLGLSGGHESIPYEWQEDILIPHLIKNGLFENLLEPGAFNVDSVKNILGDSAFISYQPVEKTICSNGYAYNYNMFDVPDTLFDTPLRNEGEQFIVTIGKDRFAWDDSVVTILNSDQTFIPIASHITGCSNDSVLVVNLPAKYTGQYNIEFKTKPLFPRRYLMLVRTSMDYGGIYDIYVNDELVKSIDYYEFTRLKGVIPSAVSGIRHINVGRFVKFDFWVENITEYGNAKVRFEYRGPANIKGSALFLDYFEFVPESKTHLITKNP